MVFIGFRLLVADLRGLSAAFSVKLAFIARQRETKPLAYAPPTHRGEVGPVPKHSGL